MVKEYKVKLLPQKMSDILNYIKTIQETQRLVGVKYEQLEQLIKQAIALHTQKQQEVEAQKKGL